ncbi:hypothetical protein F5Y13DRAFT_200266 [Hypoxylon sp. FL1857]|nr:hypothetical protein F5Y13DRAFT_200266 [Hypoxylon sp. FL1857]
MDHPAYGLEPFQRLLITVPLLARIPRSTHSNFMVNTFLGILETEPTLQFEYLPLTLSILILGNPAIYELLDCSELVYAILHRSESDVVRLLMSNPSLLHDRDCSKQTPLHFATNWPKGLSLLIEHGGESIQSIINCRNHSSGLTALDFAIMIGEVNSVGLLLDAGASIHSSVFISIRWASNRCSEGVEQITQIVVESLARQRRDLLQLALQYLPTEDIVKLELEEGKLLDDEAFVVTEALRRQGIPIPAAYDFLVPVSIYHWGALDHSIAQKLYDAGFYKLDEKLGGCTPLMTHYPICLEDWLQLISWFKNHGADFHALVLMDYNTFHAKNTLEGNTSSKINESRSTTAIHCLMQTLSREVKWCMRYRQDFHTMDVAATQPISSSLFGDRTTDSCICYCMSNGCTPSSKYLQIILKDKFCDEETSGTYRYVFGALQLAETVIPDDIKLQVWLEYIHLITFARLGMKHTCCRFGLAYPRVSDDMIHFLDLTEIEEIREEDRYLAERLEVLTKEFGEKFRELNVSFTQFVGDYLWPKLDEIEKERDELTPEESRALRETGVILDEL